MKKYIVITTINEPTEAIKKYAALNDYTVVVVGDKKTPKDWRCDNVDFIPFEKQSSFSLSKLLPENHYARKMVGYQVAQLAEADIIIDSDDDNIPLGNYGFPEFEGDYPYIEEEGFVNIYDLYTQKKLWPRGYPLNLIMNNKRLKKGKYKAQPCRVGVWQGMVNGDPDVDAICRLTRDYMVDFEESHPWVFGRKALSPFNSQNTAWTKELFPLLYLPAFVNFRCTDIIRSFVALPIMRTKFYRLGFVSPQVMQVRNKHNLLKDFESEIPLYLDGEKIVDIVEKNIVYGTSISHNMRTVYWALMKEKIVTDKETELLNLWLG